MDTPKHQHEERDVNVRAITKFGIGFALSMVVVLAGIWFLFRQFAAREARTTAPTPAMLLSEGRKLPPEPRLQASPRLDMKELRTAEDTVLNSYGWVDPDKGIVRIPIDRAMDLIAKRGAK